jgi:3-dehydroquinate synthase
VTAAGPATELRVRVPDEAGSYRVLVEPGALARLGELAVEAAPAHRYAVIADATVAELYADPAAESFREQGHEPGVYTFPPGEPSKSREEWARLTDALLADGVGRDGAVVALGGGVTGDLAGYVAATYMRGIPVVQVPTTLLAMLDSSVGGKTGVDTRHGKNLVGAFHHPALVVVDPEVLATLPRRERAAGLAEGVKAAALADGDLLGWIHDSAGALLDAEPGPVTRLVERGVAIKADVVAEDPGEAGRRAVLNFGHTVGHALERLAGYRLLHGHAVAAGMRVEAALGEVLGVTREGTLERLAGTLSVCGLGTVHESGPEPGALMEAMATDKKAREGKVRFVLLERSGRAARGPGGTYTRSLPRDGARDVLREAIGRAVAAARASS